MSHDFETGFVTRQKAWHGLAKVLENNPSIDEALEEAGLNWKVESRPLTTTIGDHHNAGVDGAGVLVVPELTIEVPSHRAVVRTSDQSVLGVVSKDWKPFQNAEALAVFKDLVNDGTLKIETAGSLQKGRKVWIQCRYADDIEVLDGDKIAPFILIALGHDGKMSIVFMNTPTRVVCWNTMQAAGAVEDATAGKAFDKPGVWRVSHMGNVQAKVEEARDAIVAMNRELGLSVEQYRKMAKQPVTELKVAELARTIFDSSMTRATSLLETLRNDQSVRSEMMDVKQRQEVAVKIDEIEKMLADWKPSQAEQKVVAAFKESPGADIAGETAWGAVNAVTYYLDHGKRGSQDTRMSSSWFGEGARQRREAFAMASELTS